MLNWRYLSLLVLAALSLNCFNEPLAPVVPTWDTNVTFPLGSRTYSLADLIAKQTNLLSVGANNQIVLSKSVDLRPTYVGDLLQLSPKDTAVHMEVGAFSVTMPARQTAIDIPWMPRGQVVPVPDTVMNLADQQSQLDGFQNITVKSGTISLRIDNNLPVAIDLLSPIRLLDLSGGTIATFTFSPATIPARGSRTASENLASKNVDNDYKITGLSFHTPGSATPVQIPSGDLLVATISTSNVKASQATLSDVPAQRIADNDTAKLLIDDSTFVKELHLKSGSLNFAMQSNVALPMTFKFRFLDLQRRVGSSYVPYEDSLYLAANGSGTMALNLVNTRIKALDGSLLRSLSILSTVAIPAMSGQTVEISETDRVSIAVTKNSNVVIDSAVAVVKPTWVNVDTRLGFNLGKTVQKFSGQINIPAAQLGLSTLSSIGFPSDAYLKIGARKANGDSVFMNIPASQRRIAPGQDAIQFDGVEVGRFLSQLASKLPDSLRVSGRILINPPDVYTPSSAGLGTIGSNCSVSGAVNLSLPLEVGIVDGIVRDTIMVGDTTANGQKGPTIDQSIIDRCNYGKVYIELENGLPAELSFDVALMNKSYQSLLRMPQSGQQIRLSGAQVDVNGNVLAPGRSTTLIELNRQEISQFNPSEFVAFNVALNTSAGSSSVKFKSDNKVKIRVWTTLSAKVK